MHLQDGHPTSLNRVCSEGIPPQLPEPGLVFPLAGELQMRDNLLLFFVALIPTCLLRLIRKLGLF